MAGSPGLIASLIKTVIDAIVSEDQIPELMKRRKLASLAKECKQAHAEFLANPNDSTRAALAAAAERLQLAADKP